MYFKEALFKCNFVVVVLNFYLNYLTTKPFKLAGNYSQKAGNAISETLYFKYARESMLPDPLDAPQLFSLCYVPIQIQATKADYVIVSNFWFRSWNLKCDHPIESYNKGVLS